MNKIELLAPVGDFECLKAAVQNGADAVYLGASMFSARASARNFDLQELEDAISYAHLRGVKVHLALNTLLKNDELEEAISLARYAYEMGIDALIVQDFGLCSILQKEFPDLPLHASTQMSIHNLEGVKQLESLGFSRVVLSRETSVTELEFIKNHSNIELEVFIHGALCVSYSGQCLLSSMIGGRSGNRGRCAQACRLPYELIVKSNKEICMDKGYLLSPKDLCGISYIPELIRMGISSLKIEGRMKTPEYVATVTRIYRKYIDLAYSEEEFVFNVQDEKDLLQVFNRGGFSTGHLSSEPNRNLVFKEKPNNMGIYIGNVANYNAKKGHITLNLNDNLTIGDTVCFEKEETKYRISELMMGEKNIDYATKESLVTIGRMKGNIAPGNKIYKLDSKTLINKTKSTYVGETRKRALSCAISVRKNAPVTISVSDQTGLKVDFVSSVIPTDAVKQPVTKERVIAQFSKTGNSPFEFEHFEIDIEDGVYLSIRDMNELRRCVLEKVACEIVGGFRRASRERVKTVSCLTGIPWGDAPTSTISSVVPKKISLLLNTLDVNVNYAELENVDRVYIPLSFFALSEYDNILKLISNRFDTYIYMPTILKSNYRNLFTTHIDRALEEFRIKGFVVSNLGTLYMLEPYKNNYEFIGNYTLNVFNSASAYAYRDLGLSNITLSPELNKEHIANIANSCDFTELIVYGKTPVMTLGYCVLGKSNKCYPNCKALCKSKNDYYLKDRLGLYFRVIADNVQTINTIYNSKITSLDYSGLPVNSVRIDILDENILEMNHIIQTVKQEKRLEGKDYTSANFIREV